MHDRNRNKNQLQAETNNNNSNNNNSINSHNNNNNNNNKNRNFSATFRHLRRQLFGNFTANCGQATSKQRILNPALHLLKNEFSPSLQ